MSKGSPSSNSQATVKDKSEYQQRESLKNYEMREAHFQKGGRDLQAQAGLRRDHYKLQIIHYVVIITIAATLAAFTLFLVMSYIPQTKPMVMKFIDQLLGL